MLWSFFGKSWHFPLVYVCRSYDDQECSPCLVLWYAGKFTYKFSTKRSWKICHTCVLWCDSKDFEYKLFIIHYFILIFIIYKKQNRDFSSLFVKMFAVTPRFTVYLSTTHLCFSLMNYNGWKYSQWKICLANKIHSLGNFEFLTIILLA